MLFTCPLCGAPLKEEQNRWYCPKGHSYDKARSGYVNLLLAGGKHAKLPGDNKMMVASRQAFLNKGYYRPMADVLCETAAKYLPEGGVLLDAGCGEGYYTALMAKKLEAEGKPAEVYGVDISKFALDKAARRRKDIRFAAASVFHMPMTDDSVDLMTEVFAPYCGEEFARILRPGGIMLLVIPAKLHLWELKCAIYDEPYENEVRDYPLEGFEFIESIPVDGEITLDNNEDIQSLFQMTPYYYKTSEEGQRRAAALQQLTTRTSFEVLVYRKCDYSV